jgi:hypothetical protein
MIPINLVLFQWRLKLFDTKLKTSLPDLRLENIGWKNPGRSVRNELTQTDPDLVDDEDLRPQTDLQRLTMRDLKKWKNINTHPIVIVLLIITLYYFTLASAIEFIQIFIILLWSQINVLSSIRLTGGRQIDFKVSSWMPKYFF